MTNPNDKLDFSAISFDDMLGEGLDTVTPEAAEAPVAETIPEEDLPEFEEEYEEYEDDEDGENSLEELTISAQISEALGLDLGEDYDDTVEGLTDFVRDMSHEVAEDQLESLFEEYPEIKRHLDYVRAGGDEKQFYASNSPDSDYSNIQMAETDISLQRAMLGEYFKEKGHPNDFIMDVVNDYEESGKLFGKALAAQEQLSLSQAAQREHLYNQQMIAQEESQAAQEEFWGDVANTIAGGNEFAGVRIPDNDKQNFFNYISNPINDQGNTQRDVDYETADMDIKLAIDYLMYSGFNLSDIINTKARTQSVQNLRTRIQSNEANVKSARKAQRVQTTFDPDELDINALF